MSDQHPDRPDGASADPPSTDLSSAHLSDADVPSLDAREADSATVDEPRRDDPADGPVELAAPVDDGLAEPAPPAGVAEPAEPTEPDDVGDRPPADEHDAVSTDPTGDVLTRGPVHDVVDAPTADADLPDLPAPPASPDVVPDGEQAVPAPGAPDIRDGGVPSDVVHVDDDALVRPLDAPLAHVLGKDADDLSVLAAPADATDPDLPVGAPDDTAPTGAPDADASTAAWHEHVRADDDPTGHVDADPSTAAWDEHVRADDDPTGHVDADRSIAAWDDGHAPQDRTAGDADGDLAAPVRDEPLPDEHTVAHVDAHAPDAGAVDDPRAAVVAGGATPLVVPAAAAAGPVPPPAVPTATAPAPRSGWSVLGRALAPRVNRAQVLAGVLCALLGFALAVQIRQTSDLSLSGMRQADLVRILDEATTRGDSLERERADLLDERDELLSGSDTRQAALDALRRSAETQGILAGRLPAEGRGVVVTVSDGSGQVKPVTMLNMLEELRNAGAEAMQLNDLRITASSAFTGTAGAVQLDGATLTAPYVWKAIGDPDTIATALQMPGGAFAEVRNNGGNASVEPQDLVEVSAIRVVPDPVHATPVPPAAG